MTIKAGLLGSPLRSSLSPALFASLSSVTGEDYDYALEENRGPGLAGALRRIRAAGWIGFNVTLPLKETIVPLLDALTPEAEEIGAVNAVKVQAGRLLGHNTDAPALLSALRGARRPVAGRVCAVWGAGGAARAALWALSRAGAREVHIHARSPGRARALSRHFSARFSGVVFRVKGFRAAPDADAAVFVNATPLGMYGPLDPCLGFRGPAGALCCDFAYAPGLTPFLAGKAGAKIHGRDLLALQALKALEFWTGRRFAARQASRLRARAKSVLADAEEADA